MVSASARAQTEIGSGSSPKRVVLGHAALKPVAALADATVLMLTGMAAIVLYDWARPERALNDNIGGVVAATTLFVALSWFKGLYDNDPARSWQRSALRALRTWGTTLCCLALCAFLLKIGSQFSRGSALLYAGLGAMAVMLTHSLRPGLVRAALDKGSLFCTPVLLVDVTCGLAPVDTLPTVARRLRSSGLRAVATIEWDMSAAAIFDSERLGQIEAHVRAGGIQEIVLVPDQASLGKIEELVEALRVFPVPIRCVFPASIQALVDRSLTRSAGVVLAEYQRAPLSVGDRVAKRLLDISLASSGLLLLLPLLLVTAALIACDSRGPVIFKQWRRGFGGRPFKIFKFRSMIVAEDGATVTQARRNDARVTRIGRFIRRTSIDELPQLLNVLMGNMSIVGPRPHAMAHDDHYARLIEEYAFRHHAKPGLTGWAQVKGLRGETVQVESMQARVEKDIWYIDNWSIWLDLQIILRTVWVVLRQEKAY